MIRVEAKTGKQRIVALKLTGIGAERAPGAYTNFYDATKHYSEIPPTLYAYTRLCEWAKEQGIEIQIIPSTLRWLEQETMKRFEFRQPHIYAEIDKFGLYEHQVDAVQTVLSNAEHAGIARMLIADEPRLGKSAEALSALRLLVKQGHVLILCPKALTLQWQQYVETWWPEAVSYIVDGPAYRRDELLGGIINQLQEYTDMVSHDGAVYVTITNWETLHMPAVYKAMQSIEWQALVGDEAHKLKNRQSKVRTLLSQLKVKHMLLLSATFTENWPSDWWSPLNLLDPQLFSSYWRWVGFFIETRQGEWGIEFDKPKDSDILRNFVAPYVIQRHSDDVVDMPEKLFETYHCQLGDEHRAFYDEVVAKLRVELSEGTLTMVNKVSKILRLRQAVVHPLLLDEGTTVDLETGKLAVLKSLLEDVIPEDEQVLVYSNFIKGCQLAAQVLEPYRPVVYAGNYGEASDIEKFQAGEYRVFCATPQKGGVGLNLFNANYLIFMDVPWSTIIYRQAEERVRAMNKKGPVYIMRLEVEDSIDQYVSELVGAKMANVKETEIVDKIIKEVLSVS